MDSGTIPRGMRKEGHVDLEYRGKLMLAPMVRIGTLPMRWLSLKYGADIVYSPELVDRRLSRSIRIENPLVGTVDFIDEKDGSVNLRVHPDEKDKLIVQLGSSDPENAVAAAKMVMNDVAGIDLNCGCPKRFSTINAMGAALLSEPDRLCSILSALVTTIPLPITCKIRMLKTQEETIELVKKIERTGVSAIALHCRQREERPQDPGHWDIFEPVAKSISIPLIANGDLYSMADIQRLKRSAQPISSFMIARAAQANFSVFSPTGPIPLDEAIVEYLRCSMRFDMPFHNAKYAVTQMWTYAHTGEERNKVISVRSYRELCTSFGLESEYDTLIRDRAQKAIEIGRTDLLSKEVQGVLGPDCPYIPDAPYIPSSVAATALKEGAKKVDVVEDDDEIIGFGSLTLD